MLCVCVCVAPCAIPCVRWSSVRACALLRTRAVSLSLSLSLFLALGSGFQSLFRSLALSDSFATGMRRSTAKAAAGAGTAAAAPKDAPARESEANKKEKKAPRKDKAKLGATLLRVWNAGRKGEYLARRTSVGKLGNEENHLRVARMHVHKSFL